MTYNGVGDRSCERELTGALVPVFVVMVGFVTVAAIAGIWVEEHCSRDRK